MKLHRFIPVLALTVLGWCGAQAGEWAAYQHDVAHTGQTNAAINPSKLALAWSAPGYTGALIVGDTLYAKNIHDGLFTTVASFSLADGRTNWKSIAPELYFGNLAVGDDFVVLEGFPFNGGDSDVLAVFDKATGILRYRLRLPLQFSFTDPTLVRADDSGKKWIAYCTDSGTLVSVLLR